MHFIAHDNDNFVLSEFDGEHGQIELDFIDLAELVIVPNYDFSVGVLAVVMTTHQGNYLVSKQELCNHNAT